MNRRYVGVEKQPRIVTPNAHQHQGEVWTQIGGVPYPEARKTRRSIGNTYRQRVLNRAQRLGLKRFYLTPLEFNLILRRRQAST